ncbi:MAG: hypothetical protein IKF01_02610 [Bacilli bacterium]|nr:hypothetical protein [Bacilli bacterium]
MKKGILLKLIVLFTFFIPSFALAMDLNEAEQMDVLNNTEQIQNENIENNVTQEDVIHEASNEQNDEGNIVSLDNDEHRVEMIIRKVDENGNSLEGAVLQIIDSNGIVVDEWVSDGTFHTIMLKEGDYVLHEKQAPNNYIIAEDKPFTVKVGISELDAGVDFSDLPCNHYGGTPLYYVEINGVRSEVYCINQDLETPDDNSKYDGVIIKPDNIKDFTQQSVYVDAHQNKSLTDISDQSLSLQQLYDKVLDIIYHRQKASEIFSDLREAEIRYVTESALKNYVNAGLTRVQRVSINSAPENYQSMDYYITDDGKYIWYLYPWYRSFIYDPNAPIGKDIFKTVIGSGDAFGNLARHWNSGHNAKRSEEVRKQIARYYELYQYLISDSDYHPSDMHLYVYASNDKSLDMSDLNFDGGAYQNLLGVVWYNPHDENVKMEIIYVNKEVPKENYPKDTYKETLIINPQTGDNINIYVISLTISIALLTSQYLRKIVMR